MKEFKIGVGIALILFGVYFFFPQSNPQSLPSETLELTDLTQVNYIPNLPPSSVSSENFEVLTFSADGSSQKESLSLDSLRGKPFIIHFWTTWCPHCVEELPTFLKFIKSRSVTYLAISNEELTPEEMGTFLKKYNITSLKVILDPKGKLHSRLSIRGMPTTVLVNSQTREIGRIVGSAPWENNQFAELLIKKMKL